MSGAPTPRTVRRYLYAVVAVAQVLAGLWSVFVTYILAPRARETFEFGPALLAAASEPILVPIGVLVAVFLLVRRFGMPEMEGRHVVVLFGVAFASFYVGFWALGIPTPTAGRIPLQGNLAAWQLIENTPYLPYAWSVFLLPGIEGGVAALAGVGVGAVLSGDG